MFQPKKSKLLSSEFSRFIAAQPEWIAREVESLQEVRGLPGTEVVIDASNVFILSKQGVDLLVIDTKVPCFSFVGAVLPPNKVLVRYENGFVLSMHLDQKFKRFYVHDIVTVLTDADLVCTDLTYGNFYYGISRVEFE